MERTNEGERSAKQLRKTKLGCRKREQSRKTIKHRMSNSECIDIGVIFKTMEVVHDWGVIPLYDPIQKMKMKKISLADTAKPGGELFDDVDDDIEAIMCQLLDEYEIKMKMSKMSISWNNGCNKKDTIDCASDAIETMKIN